MGKIVKLLDETQGEDYFPLSVSEAIYHKEEGGTLKQLSEIIPSFITTEEAQQILNAYAYSKEESDDRYPQFEDLGELIYEEI